MRIGEAANIIGVPAHVLRHWEDVGAVVPPRLSSGHRDYDDETIAAAQIVRLCQGAGMSLGQIVELGASAGTGRAGLVAAHRRDIAVQIESLQAIDGFLGHILECRHPLLHECPDCSTYAASGATAFGNRLQVRDSSAPD
ncbi:hypothetical protein MP11Mi_31500 [Gordonia sp. MP11Mi]|uniref:HTH merR-type domain-containing protein n=2 Tax=Gordonia sp. MP11Mi TaxID=3022769 RepID=A0AA97GXS1_9ACTN